MKKVSRGEDVGHPVVRGSGESFKTFSIVVPGEGFSRFNFDSMQSMPGNMVAIIQLVQNGLVVGIGTGFLIDADILLTAKHVFENSFDFYNVAIGYDPRSNLRVPVKKVRSRILHNSLDLSVLLVEGLESQWFRFARRRPKTNDEVEVAGYGFNYVDGGLRCSRGIGSVTELENQAIGYLINTSAGDSGGPVFRKNNNVYEVLGVHVEGAGDPFVGNKGVLLNPEVISDVRDMIRLAREQAV